MHIIQTHKTVAEYCEDYINGKVIVNRDYQRSRKVWPAAAQSFLIESILLGYPVPKLALYELTDRISRKTVREIVDGQQRSEAISAFYSGGLRLSNSLEFDRAAGRTYGELDEDLQDGFLAYPLGIDLFVDSTEKDVREIFRRINSYEVPLNPEEQRHARWQGAFKWFVYHLSSRHDQVFLELGTFGQKALVRMQDMKWITEVTHALLSGITTTNKAALDSLYKSRDASFPEEAEISGQIEDALEIVRSFDAVHQTALSKTYQLYSLVLAVIHSKHNVVALQADGIGGGGLASAPEIEARLAELADAIEAKDENGDYGDFVRASTATNVAANRRTRFNAYLDALAG